jgi:hypothetical protein
MMSMTFDMAYGRADVVAEPKATVVRPEEAFGSKRTSTVQTSANLDDDIPF